MRLRKPPLTMAHRERHHITDRGCADTAAGGHRSHWIAYDQVRSLINSPGGIFVLATMGMQGKYLEVFAVGMLCALFYVLTVERHMLSAKRVRQLGLIALVGARVYSACDPAC